MKKKVTKRWLLTVVIPTVFSILLLASCSPVSDNTILSGSSAGLSKVFQTPPDSVKPSGYWWWINGNVDKEAITRDLTEFKDKGIGAVLLISSGNWPYPAKFTGHPFLSPEWRELYKHALRVADRLGIKMDVNIAPGWNMGGPWVTPEKACRWFLQSEITMKGPRKFSGKLPLPGAKDGYDSEPQNSVKNYINLPLEELDYRDAVVVAFRTPMGVKGGVGVKPRKDLPAKSNRVDGDVFVPASKIMSQTLYPWKESENDQPIRLEDIVDLTSRLKSDGTLEWDIPEGEWTDCADRSPHDWRYVIGAYAGARRIGKRFLDRAGVELMYEKVGKILIEDAGPLAGKSLRGFCSDSFECGYPNWTANMIKRFKQYRGYDPIPYLPVFRGWIVGNAEISDRFLYDYRKTVADCMADEHYGRFTELCHADGLLTRCESAGPCWSSTMCMDGLKNLGRVDFPQGEFWRYLFFVQDGQNMVCKQTATAAHIYGKRTASAEALTAAGPDFTHWDASPEALKPTVDRAFCEGINNCVFSTMTSQRPQDGKPGYEYGSGTHFNPNVTWWNQAAGPWVGYINRCQALLQSGLFVADILYYNGDWAPNLVGPKHVDPSLGKGYDYDVCNAEVLLTRLSVKDGKIVLPDGMSYRLLVLPDSKRMPVEIIQKIAELVKAGATIVGPRPESDPGLKDYPNSDETVGKISKILWGDIDGKTTVEHQVGKGRVIWGKSLRDILQADGVNPDFEVTGQQDVFIDYIHRDTPDADLYFLVNRNERAEKVALTFRQDKLQPELWNPVNGKQRDLPQFVMDGGRTTIPLEFEPNGSTFIVFRKRTEKADGKTRGKNFVEFKTVQEVKGPWKVSFDKEWFYPLDGLTGEQVEGKIVFDKLEDWSQRPEQAVKYFSGTAVYSTEFLMNQDLAYDEKYWLDLGVVSISASVLLNGVDLGVVWCEPWRVNISKALRKGVNKLELDVVNQWPNRLIGDQKLPEEKRHTQTNIKVSDDGGRKWELKKSGLIGPVKVLSAQNSE